MHYGRGKHLKNAALISVLLLAVSVFAGAENTDTDLENSKNTSISSEARPSEDQLFLDKAPAGNTENEQSSAGSSLPGIGFGDFLRMIIVLGFVILMIYGFIWLLRRFSGQKGSFEDVIDVVSTRPLKGDSALHIVEIGGKMYLLGSGSSGVSLLTEITDEDSINQIKLSVSQIKPPSPGGFVRMLRERSLKGQIKASGIKPEEPVEDNHADFLRAQREKLSRL